MQVFKALCEGINKLPVLRTPLSVSHLLARQNKHLPLAQAALRPRNVWGAVPKTADCGSGIFPQKPSQTPGYLKPPEFSGLVRTSLLGDFSEKAANLDERKLAVRCGLGGR